MFCSYPLHTNPILASRVTISTNLPRSTILIQQIYVCFSESHNKIAVNSQFSLQMSRVAQQRCVYTEQR